MQLIHLTSEYRSELMALNTNGKLNEGGRINLDSICTLLESIINQQSEELKVIE